MLKFKLILTESYVKSFFKQKQKQNKIIENKKSKDQLIDLLSKIINSILLFYCF